MTASGPSAQRERIDGLFELAFRRHQAGRLREAEELYRSILDADPRQLDALYFSGMIALQDGRPQDAVDLIGRAIAGNDRVATYQAGIAEAYRALAQPEDAVSHLRNAIAIEPGHWAALHQLAKLLLERGDANEALEIAKRALTWKDTAQGQQLFADCLRDATSLPGDPVFRALLIRAFAGGWAQPAELAPASIAMIKSHPTVVKGIAHATASWPRRLTPQECGPVIGVLAADDLLRAVMNSTPVGDEGLDRLLASVRTILLDAAIQAQADVSSEMIVFACSLARQCFANGYAYDVPEAEQRGLAWLRGNTASALAGKAPVFAIHVIALASYIPLTALDRQDGLRRRKWPAPVEHLIAEHLRAGG